MVWKVKAAMRPPAFFGPEAAHGDVPDGVETGGE
jgi:hypothetical protein